MVRILIAEDNKDTNKLIVDILNLKNDNKYTVDSALNGAIAKDMIDKSIGEVLAELPKYE